MVLPYINMHPKRLYFKKIIIREIMSHCNPEEDGKREMKNIDIQLFNLRLGFPGGSDGKESACSAGDPFSIPWLDRFPGERNGSPFQYSWLENSMDRRAWWAIVHGIAKNQT